MQFNTSYSAMVEYNACVFSRISMHIGTIQRMGNWVCTWYHLNSSHTIPACLGMGTGRVARYPVQYFTGAPAFQLQSPASWNEATREMKSPVFRLGPVSHQSPHTCGRPCTVAIACGDHGTYA